MERIIRPFMRCNPDVYISCQHDWTYEAVDRIERYAGINDAWDDDEHDGYWEHFNAADELLNGVSVYANVISAS